MTGTRPRADAPRVPAGLRRGLLVGIALAAAVGIGFAWRGEPTHGPAGDPARSAALVADGAWLFQAKGCATCHTDQARGSPDLTGAAEWAAGRKEAMSADEYLAESIREPSAVISPQLTPESTLTMPRLNVTDEEVDALFAYLLED